MTAFHHQTSLFLAFLDHVPAEKLNFAYAPGKWTVKQVLQHITDTERIFAYRALRFARKDQTPLSGFKENDYAVVARVDHREWLDLVEEFQMVRVTTEHLFRSLSEEEMFRSGTANESPFTVLSIGYIILGHAIHHRRVLEERYF